MALPANVQWEIRTGGSDSNGGGFVSGASGTDFSQQDAAQYTFTDLAVDPSVNTKVTSASHNFVASDVGNLMQITAGAGFTQGFYQIVSVASNAATLDRSPAATSTTGGTFAVGGGLLTVSKPIASLNSSLNHTIWVKAGTYTVTASIDFTGVTSATGLTLQGYTSSHGDTGQATITTSTNSVKLIKFPTSSGIASCTFRNFLCSNTAGTRDDGLYTSTGGPSGFMLVDHCVFDGFNIALQGQFSGNYYWQILYIVNTEIKNSISHGHINAGNTVAVGCWSHGNGGDGFNTGGNTGSIAQTVLIQCVASGNTGVGARQTAVLQFLSAFGSVFYNNTSDGMLINTSRGPAYVLNNIFDSNGAFGLHLFDTPGVYAAFSNAYRNNTSGPRSGVGAGVGDVTLTAIPFTNAGAGDFSLNSTAGGGAACKAVGFPGVVPDGTGFLDIGALQSQGSGGSTTVYVIAPNQTRFVGSEEN